jgi:hypothetical protein
LVHLDDDAEEFSCTVRGWLNSKLAKSAKGDQVVMRLQPGLMGNRLQDAAGLGLLATSQARAGLLETAPRFSRRSGSILWPPVRQRDVPKPEFAQIPWRCGLLLLKQVEHHHSPMRD